MNKWDLRFMSFAEAVADWSKDPESKVGCILVSPDKRRFSFGYNGFARGIEDSSKRLQVKEIKNKLMVHAEQNAIYNSDNARGWTAYTTKAPCVNCANALIQAGIARLVTIEPSDYTSWFDQQVDAIALMLEAGLEITYI